MRSAGILLYRRNGGRLEVLLAHPGGPFCRKRDAGVWGIPKGLIDEGEDPLAAARREFFEETGVQVPGQGIALQPLRQRSRKIIHAWAIEGDCDANSICSNTFTMEWPPKSGRTSEFPEIDRAEWFGLDEARARINPGQAPFLDELSARISPDRG